MTEQTQPTDAELRAWVQSLIADDDSVRTNDERDHMSFARAVLAKWGTPAGAGEPYGYVYTEQVAPIVGDERKVERTVFTRNKPPCNALALYTTPPAQAADSVLKDHQIAALVNELRGIAIKYHGTQQLRERIAHAVVPAFKAHATPSALEDAHALLQEVAACFTRDDDLPDNLLPRIDAVLNARKQGGTR